MKLMQKLPILTGVLTKNKSKMKTYILTLKHDNGPVKIRVFADSIQGAINAVTNAENCPECAIINIKVLTNNK